MIFGITGLAKTGKTTLFNLLTGSSLDTGKFSATVEEIHRAVAKVPDERLNRLAQFFNNKKKVPVSIDFLDFGGLALGGDRDSKLVGELRTINALVHVLRAFEDDEIIHESGEIDPRRDAENFMAELILNDLVQVENRLERMELQMKKMKTDELVREQAALLRVKEHLEADTPLRDADISHEDEALLRGYGFLSQKPLLFALNVGEEEANDLDAAVEKWNLSGIQSRNHIEICPLCANIEEEISQLDEEERPEFMADLGIEELGSIRFLQSAYKLLGLITFFTGSEKDSHAWTVPAGSNAHKAAGAIHTDIARGFIRAEVIPVETLLAAGSMAEAKANGDVSLEGKDYIMQDGDYIIVRFNV